MRSILSTASTGAVTLALAAVLVGVAPVGAARAQGVAARVEAHLSAHDYFAGSRFSAADCLMGFQIVGMGARGDLANRPATRAWLDRVTARPAYKAMLQVGV